jgi:hypothetical protein
VLPSTQVTLSPQSAKKEQDRRKLARAKFLYFCKYTDPKFEDAAHMTLVANKLEQVARYLQTGGKEGIGRLMILMPPRHGKSEMASRKFFAWLMGANEPDHHGFVWRGSCQQEHVRCVT